MIQYRIASDVPVQANSSAKVSCVVPLAGRFQPTWFSVPDDVAGKIVVTDVKVGKNSQLISTGCLPGSLFSFSSCQRFSGRARIMMDLVSPGRTIELDVQNVSTVDVSLTVDVCGYSEGAIGLEDLELKYALGLGYTLVRAESEAKISVQPQVTFVPDEIFLSGDVLEAFEVQSLMRGVPGEDEYSACPSELLAADRLRAGGEVRLAPHPTSTIANFLTTVVKNRLSRGAWFQGAVLGRPATHPAT